MHYHPPTSPGIDEGKQRLRNFGFAGAVGILLLLNLLGVFSTVFGIDTAAILALVAGYRTFYNAIAGLLEKKISADLAICVAVVAALAIGEYVAAAEAMLIMLVGEGLEGYAAGRTAAAIHRFVEQLPRRGGWGWRRNRRRCRDVGRGRPHRGAGGRADCRRWRGGAGNVQRR